MAVNLLYLSLIVLIPFTTDVLDGYGDVPVGPILYSVVIAGASAVAWWMNRHALQRDLVRPEEVPAISRGAAATGPGSGRASSWPRFRSRWSCPSGLPSSGESASWGPGGCSRARAD